jgi:hypothetical protein
MKTMAIKEIMINSFLLDILNLFFFLGERGLSFGDYSLNYVSRFYLFVSFNLPIGY